MCSMKLDRPRISVDFNELMEPDLVLLSQTDHRVDSDGTTIHLSKNAKVYIYEYNKYDDGEEELFTADGIVELNDKAINKNAKWSCRIDTNGITTKYT
jgi:hypothetical protein